MLAVRNRLGDESGIALVMALGIMLVLVIALTTVITFTAAGARDSHRVNAGQKATALAEAGVNNALAVLTKNYPGVVVYPGDPDLLPSRTTTYPSGTVTWSGVILVAALTLLAIAFVQSGNRLAAAIALGLFASAVSCALVLIAAQDRPFNGDFRVRPDVLQQVYPRDS